MNLYTKCYHYDISACSGKKHRGIVQSCVDNRVCFGKRGSFLCKSHDVEIRMLAVCIVWEEERKEV
jgi:hypothetical protein